MQALTRQRGWLSLLRLLADEDTNNQVLAAQLETVYNLDVTLMEPGEGCYTVFTREGVFQLYHTEQPKETIAILQCWDYLQGQGLAGLGTLRVTSSGDLGFYFNDQLTYMSTRAVGRRGELSLKEDGVRIASVLAELHLLSQQLPLSLQEGVERSKPIEPALIPKRQELNLFRIMALNRLYPKAFDLFYLEIYDHLAGLLHCSVDLLTEIGIHDLETDPKLVGLLQGNCHGRMFRVTDDGKVQLPNLKKSTWGLLALDVAALLGNINEYAEGSLAIAQGVLAAYQAIRPLCRAELGLIYGLGIFPEGVWEAAYDYYKGSRKLDEPEAMETLRREWGQATDRQEYWQRLLGDELGYEDRH